MEDRPRSHFGGVTGLRLSASGSDRFWFCAALASPRPQRQFSALLCDWFCSNRITESPKDCRGWLRWRLLSSHAPIHRLIGQAVGFPVLLAQGMANREPIELRNQFLGPGVQVLEGRILDLVNALHLPHQQFGVADHLERLGTVLQRVLECGKQPLIFGKVVGLLPEVLTECSDFPSRFIVNDYSIPRRAWIAAGAAVAVGNEVVLGSLFVGFEK